MSEKGKPLTKDQRDAVRALLENFTVHVTHNFTGREGPGYNADVFCGDQLFGLIVDEGNGGDPWMDKAVGVDDDTADACWKAFETEMLKTPPMPEWRWKHTPEPVILEALVRASAVRKKAKKNPTNTYAIPLDSGWLDCTINIPLPNFSNGLVEKSLLADGHDHYVIVSPQLSADQYHLARTVMAVKRQRELYRKKQVVVLTKDDKIGAVSAPSAWENPELVRSVYPGAYIPLLDPEQKF